MLSASLSRRNNQKRFYRLFIFSIISLLAIFIVIPLTGHDVHAADITLEWDPNPEPDIAGYKIYYGFGSRDYSEVVDVGNWTTCTIGDLESGVTYYFAVTAYNTSGYESGYSNEVSYTPAPDGQNEPPVADAGPDQTVAEGAMVTLDGSSSYDSDDGISSYEWIQISGTPVTLSNPSSTVPTFVAHNAGDGGTSLVFQLTVTDNGSLQSADTCTVTVTLDNNVPPVADAGPDQTVAEGAMVTLDGSSSYDSDDGISSYEWIQISGTPVNLFYPSSAVASFVAPTAGSEGVSLTFQLTVRDNGSQQSTDTCIVNVTWNNAPPVADAGPDQTVTEGTTVTLDGFDSYDPDGMIVSYQWTQTEGSLVTLSDPEDVTPTFVTPPVDSEGATLVFELTITDDGGLEATGTVTVRINDNGITSLPQNIITTRLSSGDPIGFKEDKDGKLISLTIIESLKLPEDAGNMPLDFEPNDLIDMQIKVPKPGDKTTITVYLEKPAPGESKLYYYSRIENLWSDYSNYAEFNATRNQVKITLEDGGSGDDDGELNGIIVDPFTFALSSEPASLPSGGSDSAAGGGGGGGGGCFIGSVTFTDPIESTGIGITENPEIVLLILFGIILWIRFRKAV
jgi:hypothetical protein